MAGFQFDELTKDLAGAKSRRGFLKGLLGAGAAVAATMAFGPGVVGAAHCGEVMCTGQAPVCCAQGTHHYCCPKGKSCGNGFSCV